MTDSERFFGPTLSEVGRESAFTGEDFQHRMSHVREQILAIRQQWQRPEKYAELKDLVRDFLMRKQQLPQSRQQVDSARLFRERVERLLQGYYDYADMDMRRPEAASTEACTALELYCSQEGYRQIYGLCYALFRTRNVNEKDLITAVTLVEYLTIELYNLRLSNIADERYENFSGITYRGMDIDEQVAQRYRDIATNPDLSKRHFAIPLGFMSSTTDTKTMLGFAKGACRMYWKIHIHGLDSKLLRRYLGKYPDSVVTSICAMPVARISAYGEMEILLRGPFFHIINMKSRTEGTIQTHEVEMVMINSNRDHGTELGSNEGDKGKQRAFFGRIIRASRYEICASLAHQFSEVEAQQYRTLALETMTEIDKEDPPTRMYDEHLAEERSHARRTWHGACQKEAYPQHYAEQRVYWHNALRNGDWHLLEHVLAKEYESQRSEWFNLFDLVDPLTGVADGYTLLHYIASRPAPNPSDTKRHEAYQRLILEVKRSNAWRTLKSCNAAQATAVELAIQHKNHAVLDAVTPTIIHSSPQLLISSYETQLETLIRSTCSDENSLSPLHFQMPQLSVLTEMESPELWIPIPGSYGGFLVRLRDEGLKVTRFQTVKGVTRPVRSEYLLDGKSVKIEETGRKMSVLGL